MRHPLNVARVVGVLFLCGLAGCSTFSHTFEMLVTSQQPVSGIDVPDVSNMSLLSEPVQLIAGIAHFRVNRAGEYYSDAQWVNEGGYGYDHKELQGIEPGRVASDMTLTTADSIGQQYAAALAAALEASGVFAGSESGKQFVLEKDKRGYDILITGTVREGFVHSRQRTVVTQTISGGEFQTDMKAQLEQCKGLVRVEIEITDRDGGKISAYHTTQRSQLPGLPLKATASEIAGYSIKFQKELSGLAIADLLRQVAADAGKYRTLGDQQVAPTRLQGPPFVTGHVPQRVSTAWAIVIGLSEYAHADTSALTKLAFADKDARDFAGTLRSLGWSGDNIRLLTNEEATKRNVTYAMETWLRRAGPDDMIVLFWAGHGWPDAQDPGLAYFACYDSVPSDPSSCWRMDRIRLALEERRARNVVVFADTCHSGKIIRSGDPRGISVVPALDAMERQKEIPKGWVFVVSADSDRKAYEDKAWSNGALTHVLLEGLRDGRADGYKSAGAKDDTVSLGELRAFITDRMAAEGLNVLGARLVPLFYTTSGDPEIWELSLGTNPLRQK